MSSGQDGDVHFWDIEDFEECRLWSSKNLKYTYCALPFLYY